MRGTETQCSTIELLIAGFVFLGVQRVSIQNPKRDLLWRVRPRRVLFHSLFFGAHFNAVACFGVRGCVSLEYCFLSHRGFRHVRRLIHKVPPTRRKHPPIRTHRTPKTRTQNPPGLDLSNRSFHHRTQPINPPIVLLHHSPQPHTSFALSRSQQPQPHISLISQSRRIQQLVQTMMLESISIMPGTRYWASDGQQFPLQGADDLVIETSSLVLA